MKNPPVRAALRFAVRESRAVLRHFKIFIASLFLGTVLIAGIGSVTANIAESIDRDGRILLGGDVEIRQMQTRLTDEERHYLGESGQLSEIAVLRSMAHSGPDSTLVDLRAVDNAYPLYGDLDLDSVPYRPEILAQDAGRWGILISRALAARLNLSPGDRVRLGISDYEVRAIIAKEPDAGFNGFQLAPGAIISLESLAANALVQPGSMVRYYNRIKLPSDISPQAFMARVKERFPDHNWRIQDSSSGGEGLRRLVTRFGQFMTLAGLTALLVGGVGVSNAVRAYLAGKTDSIATYKILGATGRTVLITYLGQILLVAAGAILAGLMVGGLLPLILGGLLGESLPVALNERLYPIPLGLAAFYSGLVAVIFTLWPLSRVVGTPSARLFRSSVSHGGQGMRSLPYLLAISGLMALLIVTVVTTSAYPVIATGTIAAVAAAFLILTTAAMLARKLARNAPRPHNPYLRIALSNIHRPGNSTIPIVLSLGLGLILFTAITLTEYNLVREINARVNGEAPSFFFIDIQQDQHEEFVSYLAGRDDVAAYRTVPNLRGRVTHVKSVAADKVTVGPEGEWILRGDRGVTFTPDLPADNRIVAGAWWPADYEGPAEVSISKQMADSMALGIGDTITVNILGRDFTTPIASIRDFSWDSFGINYVMMFDPHSLKSAPYTYVATAKAAPGAAQAIYNDLVEKFPAVSIINMTEMLASANEWLRKIAGAINIVASVTLLTGVLVLAGAIAAGHRARIYDAVVLKVVGATRRDILAAYVIEFILLGLLTGFIALLLGTAAAYAVITRVMEMSWHLPLDVPAITILVSTLVTLAFGMVSIWLALSVRPSRVLREQ